jgi:MscS family membrane protein
MFRCGICGLLMTSLLCSALLLTTALADTPPAIHPLAPPDTSSPQATLKTFLDEMNTAVGAFHSDNREVAFHAVRRATQCLNVSEQPSALQFMIGFYAAMFLKETLDRIEIPPYSEIPDAKAVHTDKVTWWTIPYTNITIASVKDASSAERFLFTPETVRHTEQYYDQVKALPYLPGTGGGAAYVQLSTSAGLMIPREFVRNLPAWAKATFYGLAAWQWCGLFLYFFFGTSGALGAYRYGDVTLSLIDQRFQWKLKPALAGLVIPIALILFAEIGLWFIVYVLHIFITDVYVPIAMVLLTISYLGTIWLIGALLNRIAAVVVAMGGFAKGSIDTQLIRLGFQLVTVIIICITAVHLSARLGLPAYSLVTGLGIGGIAVALAGREALSNVVGTVIILLDKPFKRGDFIVLGDGDRGTVTDIGLRSTRIRTRDGILVSIPNSTVANMKIVNESAPATEVRIRISIGVGYGSKVKEVEEALLAAAERCEFFVPDPPPAIRFRGFGDSSLDFQLLVWIVQPEFQGRATHQLNQAVYEELQKKGIEIPFPQRDIHVRSSS